MGGSVLTAAPLDARLVAPALGAWVAAALVLGPPIGPLSPVSAIALAGVVAALGALLAVTARGRSAALRRAATSHGGAAHSRGVRLAAAGACLAAAGAIASAALRVAAVGAGPVTSLAHQHATVAVRLTITGDPHVAAGRVSGSTLRPDLTVVPARLDAVTYGGRLVRVRSPIVVLATGAGWEALLPSQHASVDGRLSPAQSGELVSAVLDARGPPFAVTPPSVPQRIAGRVRAGLRAAAAPLPAGPRSLLPGLVDGDDAGLAADLRTDFKATGLTHLTAVSGANVAIVLGVLLVAARWAGAGPRGQALVGAVGIAGFVVLARPEPSVLRAAAMGYVALGALALGRAKQALPALAASVLLLVEFDPALARQPGFVLSVLATAGLSWWRPAGATGWPPGCRERWPRRSPCRPLRVCSVPLSSRRSPDRSVSCRCRPTWRRLRPCRRRRCSGFWRRGRPPWRRCPTCRGAWWRPGSSRVSAGSRAPGSSAWLAPAPPCPVAC